MSFFIIFVVLFLLGLIYGAQLFVILTNQRLFNKPFTKFCYLLPLYIILICVILLIASKICYDGFFSFIYWLVMTSIGYLIYLFFTSIIVRIIDWKFHLSIKFGLLLLYLIPLIISLYGLIHAINSKIVNISLTFDDYQGETKILHLSDIHLGAIHQESSIDNLVKEIQEISPDIVVITGDLADGSLQVKSEWLKPFDLVNVPILYVTGNHEEMNGKEEMIKAIETTNIKYIGKNEKFTFKNIIFIGEDYGNDLDSCLGDVIYRKGVPNVLLSHVPNMSPDDISKYNIFLLLAGHTHGGQLFPFQIFAYWANKCFSGLYSNENQKNFVFVSEGVNNSLVPMRIGSSRTLAVITIHG